MKMWILFKDKLPQDLQNAFKIIKLLIKKANLNLIHNKNTYVHFNDISIKRKYNEVQSLILSNTSQVNVEYVR